MSQCAYVKAVSFYLPKNILSNENLSQQFPEWSIEKIVSKIGIEQRHIASENETALDLAVGAAECLLKEYSVDRFAIDYVILCTQSPDYFLPTSACIIQDKLALSTSCGALDINLGCSGYVYGLSLAKALVVAGIAKNVLFLTAETYSKYLHPKDKGNRAIFGDGASATLISTDGFAKIANFSFGTDGSGAQNLVVKSGAARHRCAYDNLIFDENGNPLSSDYLFMNGSEIFNFTLEFVPLLVDDVLQKNALQKDDVNLFVFHQANKYIMNFIRKKIKIDESKFYYALADVGNTVSSSIPIALCKARIENKLHGNVLLAGFGVGYSWAGVVLNF